MCRRDPDAGPPLGRAGGVSEASVPVPAMYSLAGLPEDMQDVINMSEERSSADREFVPRQGNGLPDRGFYWIRVKGCLDDSWSEWFDGLSIAADPDCNETVLSGNVADQAALHGLLNKIRNLGLQLVGLTRREPA
jgi:hypothetical protein